MKKIFLTGPTSFLGTKFIELYGHKYDIFGLAGQAVHLDNAKLFKPVRYP